MLQDLFSLVYWSSILDLFFFIFSFCTFLVDAKNTGAIFMHIFHILRMVIGGLILIKFPKTQVILESVRNNYKNLLDQELKNEKLSEVLT